MSPMLTSQVVALATTAVSGTVILLAICLHQKTLPDKPQFPTEEVHAGGTKRRKKNKRVRFAEDVVDPTGYDDDFKKRHGIIVTNKTNKNPCSCPNSTTTTKESDAATTSGDRVKGVMPENRMALYNGILRDRLIQRMADSY